MIDIQVSLERQANVAELKRRIAVNKFVVDKAENKDRVIELCKLLKYDQQLTSEIIQTVE
jgi:hypothetical protein